MAYDGKLLRRAQVKYEDDRSRHETDGRGIQPPLQRGKPRTRLSQHNEYRRRKGNGP